MFGSNKSTDEPKSAATSSPNSLNTLVKGTAVEGSLQCESDLRVDGSIKGTLNCKAKLIIGPTGVVDGEIRCENAVIEGSFKGKLWVHELLNVRESAVVEGEIVTNKLLVQSGARFNVTCKMESVPANGVAKAGAVKSEADDSAKIAGGKAEVRN